jgi:hypothetical protein
MLKFGPNSNWPLKVIIATSLDGVNSASVTYTVSWEGCDGSTDWFRNQFVQQAA